MNKVQLNVQYECPEGQISALVVPTVHHDPQISISPRSFPRESLGVRAMRHVRFEQHTFGHFEQCTGLGLIGSPFGFLCFNAPRRMQFL